MLFYVALFVLYLLIGLLDLAKPDRQAKLFFLTIGILLFIGLAGLRWNTGTDWNSYEGFFHRSVDLNVVEPEHLEIGFTWFNHIIRLFMDNYTVILLISAVVIVGLKGVYLARFALYPLMGMFLYYCYFYGDMFFVRQGLAISMLLVSTKYIESRQFVKFLLIVAFATLFHSTAITFIPAYFIYKFRFSNNVLIGALVFGIVLALVHFDSFMLKAFAPLAGFNANLADKASKYLENGSDLDQSGVTGYMSLVLGIFKRAIILPFFFIYRKKGEATVPYYNGLLNLVVWGNFLYFATGNILPLQRVTTYYYFYEISLLVVIIRILWNKKAKLFMYCSFLVLFGLFKFIYGLQGYKDLYVPYYSIFSTNINRTY